MNTSVNPYLALRSSSRFRIWAWTDTSSADTGSSQMISSGSVTSARAIEMRWHCPPENSCGRLYRADVRVDPDLVEDLADDGPLFVGVLRPQTLSGSATTSPIMRRGFSDEIGSWKIICMSVRAGASSACRVGQVVPSSETEPLVGRGSCRIALPVVDLPQPGFTDQAERLALADVEADAADGVDDAVSAGGELDDQVVDLQEHVAVGRRCAVPEPAIS